MIGSIGDFFQGIGEAIGGLPEAFVRTLAGFDLGRAGRVLESNLWLIGVMIVVLALLIYRGRIGE